VYNELRAKEGRGHGLCQRQKQQIITVITCYIMVGGDGDNLFLRLVPPHDANL
jgi:hypothetical protein